MRRMQCQVTEHKEDLWPGSVSASCVGANGTVTLLNTVSHGSIDITLIRVRIQHRTLVI